MYPVVSRNSTPLVGSLLQSIWVVVFVVISFSCFSCSTLSAAHLACSNGVFVHLSPPRLFCCLSALSVSKTGRKRKHTGKGWKYTITLCIGHPPPPLLLDTLRLLLSQLVALLSIRLVRLVPPPPQLQRLHKLHHTRVVRERHHRRAHAVRALLQRQQVVLEAQVRRQVHVVVRVRRVEPELHHHRLRLAEDRVRHGTAVHCHHHRGPQEEVARLGRGQRRRDAHHAVPAVLAQALHLREERVVFLEAPHRRVAAAQHHDRVALRRVRALRQQAPQAQQRRARRRGPRHHVVAAPRRHVERGHLRLALVLPERLLEVTALRQKQAQPRLDEAVLRRVLRRDDHHAVEPPVLHQHRHLRQHLDHRVVERRAGELRDERRLLHVRPRLAGRVQHLGTTLLVDDGRVAEHVHHRQVVRQVHARRLRRLVHRALAVLLRVLRPLLQPRRVRAGLLDLLAVPLHERVAQDVRLPAELLQDLARLACPLRLADLGVEGGQLAHELLAHPAARAHVLRHEGVDAPDHDALHAGDVQVAGVVLQLPLLRAEVEGLREHLVLLRRQPRLRVDRQRERRQLLQLAARHAEQLALGRSVPDEALLNLRVKVGDGGVDGRLREARHHHVQRGAVVQDLRHRPQRQLLADELDCFLHVSLSAGVHRVLLHADLAVAAQVRLALGVRHEEGVLLEHVVGQLRLQLRPHKLCLVQLVGIHEDRPVVQRRLQLLRLQRQRLLVRLLDLRHRRLAPVAVAALVLLARLVRQADQRVALVVVLAADHAAGQRAHGQNRRHHAGAACHCFLADALQ
eukprot:Rhum_TRINITY_DN59_c0_g1::Rhum_TRINITY_DN59_c0_g1_i1::g.143::m.143